MEGLGVRLRRARQREALTIRELAREAGIDAGWISRIETGERANLSFAAARAIADVLGVSLDELAGRPRKYFSGENGHAKKHGQ